MQIRWVYGTDRPFIVKRRIRFTLSPYVRWIGLPVGVYRITGFGLTERWEWKSRIYLLDE